MEQLLDQGIDQLVGLIKYHYWVAPVLTLILGVLTSLTPCSLASVPLIMGYVGGVGQPDRRRAFRISLTFAAGSVLTLATLGAFASWVGLLLRQFGTVWYLIVGVITLAMGLQIMEIIKLLPHACGIAKPRGKGYAGAFTTGILGGVCASHCALPVMIVLLAVIAESGLVGWGVLIMTLFAIGHSLFIVAAGTWAGLLTRLTSNHRYDKTIRLIRSGIGLGALLLAAYMFYLAWKSIAGGA